MWLAKSKHFSVNIRPFFHFLMSLSGEVTEDELFNRLQQIKDGPEQQNNTPSTEVGEDPVGKFVIPSFFFLFLF